MLQFYFLSVLLNALTGFILFSGFNSGSSSEENIFFPFIATTESFRFAIGMLTIIIGFLKLLSPIRGDLPFIGDLLPAAVGIVSGFGLIYENMRIKELSYTVVEKIEKKVSIRRLLDSKTYMGIAAMAAAALHFLFPTVVII